MQLIHRYWTGPNEPPVDGPVWHDQDLPPVLAAWITAREHQVRPIDRPRHRSNLVRWWLLWEHGGLWLDHDATLHDTPPAGPWVAEHRGWACAAAIRLPARHPLASAMLDRLEQHPPSQLPSPKVSGAWPLTSTVRMLGVPTVEIPGPDEPPTWISHRWDTSIARRSSQDS